MPLYVWEPVSPSDDFVALGMICSNSVDPPPLKEVRCVSARFLAASSMRPKKIWADRFVYFVPLHFVRILLII